MTLGATLRHARETRALTCDDVARATRVPVRMIVAIEKDDWGKLPGGIFTRGYLRAYADEVGLEGGSVVAQYEAEHAPPPPPEAVAGGRDADDDAWHITIRAPRWSLSSVAWGRLAWPALAGGLLLAFYLTAGGAPDEDPVGQSGSAEASAQQPSNSLGGREERPVGTAATSSDAGPGDIPLPLPGVEVPLAVDLAVTRPCWLTVTVDGSRQIYRLVQPGERERQQGREFVIRAGDAGALRLSVDGQAAKPVGASGEVITFRVTRENYRSLLQASPALF